MNRIEFLQGREVLVAHDIVLQTAPEYPRVLRVRNLKDEIWLVRDMSFRPIGVAPDLLIENAIVDELSLTDPLSAFESLRKEGVIVETVGWKS